MTCIAWAGNPHKVEVTDPIAGAEIISKGGRLLADYGTYQLYDTAEAPDAGATQNPPGEMRDEYYTILLNSQRLETRLPEVKSLSATVTQGKGKQLHLVQFVGPVQPQWREQLQAAGLQVVDYIPHNAYLVYGETANIGNMRKLAASEGHIQWEAPYLKDYKIHPLARATDEHKIARKIGTDLFSVQLVADKEANAATEQLLEQLKLENIQQRRAVRQYLNFIVRLAPESIATIAARPDVISIMPYFPRRKFDERQDQIMSGHLNGNVPSGPGYLAWLASKGFTQAQFDASGFVVDVSDSGIDNGSTAPNHFGLFTGGSLTASSRVAYNRLEGFPNGGSTLSGCDGHGNLNAHIVGGFDNLSGVPFADASGYHYGLGVCPFVKVGSSVVFDPDNFTNPDYDNLQSEAYRDGARVSNNSWGGPGDGSYDIDAQNYDMLVRDAQPAGSTFGVDGNQEMVILFAAGNDGSDAVTIGSPGTSKNVISVGASENVQAFGGADLSGVADNEADSANDIVSFSSRGPCADGRHKPDLVAPGTHVSGGAPEAFNPGLTGTVDGCFTGNGVSGGPGTNLFWPLNQQFYTASSGTSHSTPAVAGACALVRQYFINQFSNPPSAAMTKAYLMNSARYLTGASAADNLWSDSQGMGGVALDTAFDGVARVVRDQLTNDMFMASGQSREYTGYISDTNKPFRVTVAWTDAPGSTVGNAYVNNLDLIVTVGGITYKGNVFRGAVSVSGGSADLKNNVESVFLPAGVSGTYTVKVLGTGINGIGVPNVNNALNQDFALVIYNATDAPIPSVQRVSATLIGEGCSPGNGAVDPGEIVTVNLGLQNFAARSTTNLIATLQTSGGVLSPSGPQVYGALAGATVVTRPFTFIANGNCGGTVTATLNLQDPAGATGATNLGTTSFSFKLGSLSSGIITLNQTFDGVTAPALPTGWTATATGVPSTWKTSAVTNATPPNAVFATNATTIGSATLLSPAINITSPAAQLNFRHFYNLEASTSPGSTVGYDGGVLEIAIGAGGFQDIIAAGGSFINGAYNRTISGSYNNPLAGRQAWSGNSPGFVTTTLILPAAAAGQSVRLRWVCGSDESLAAIGWYVDTVTISDGAYSCCAGLTPTTIVNPRRSGNSPVFSFQSINGQTYRVEYKSDLANPVWSSLQTYTGDGSLINVTDSFPVSQRFYRIRSPQ